MKKSVFTFGLLMSSLVMLSAMPLFNNNAAMAQGYNGDSYYSQYPTDDKKYECQTGPFEGFFVSSVEFCKHVKFDDKDDRKDNKDNRTGTQGPQGPQGPQGLPGINGTNGVNGTQGPPGPSTINTTNVYTVVSNKTATGTGPGLSLSSIALCDAGDTVLSGSFVTDGSAIIRSDKPLVTENGWNATAQLLLGVGPGSVTADAICFDNPPLRS